MAPWCADPNLPIDPVLKACYFMIQFHWICNLIIGFYGCYQLLTNDRKTKPLFKGLFAAISICFICAPPGYAFGIQAGWECWYDFEGWEAIYMIGLNGYLWGLSLLNIFFMLRLKIVFGTTVFQVHNGFWMIFITGLVFQGVTAIYSTERFMSGWDKDARQLAIRLYTWHNICNIIISGVICVLFVKRILVLAQLENTAASMFRSNNDSGSDVVSVSTPSQCDIGCSVTQDGNIQKRMIKQEMLNLIVRYLVCATFAMISTAMVVIFGYIRSEIIGSKDLNARAASFWVRIADSTVNLICIYLQFPFAKTPYYKCCKICNNCFQQCSLKLLGLNVSNGKTNMFESKSSISTASANAVEMTIN